MKIAWIAHATELEGDLRRAVRDHPDLELRIYSITDDPGGHGPKVDVDDRACGFSGLVVWAIVDLLERVLAWGPDLIVLRHPYWLLQAPLLYPEVHRLLRHAPVLIWHSEQGPTRDWAVLHSMGWQHVAVNNAADLEVFRSRLHDTNLYLLPCGSVNWRDDELTPEDRYKADVVIDTRPHYACKDYGGWKRQSINVMAYPVLGIDADVAIWGDKGPWCGWGGVPGAVPRYRGEYPPGDYRHVYASSRVYVGPSWNWAHGGWGIKLARALSCGIPVIWHRTVWAEEDGLTDGDPCLFSDSPAKTRSLVQKFLDHPDEAKALGQKGRDWVRRWEWGANLKRVYDEFSRRS